MFFVFLNTADLKQHQSVSHLSHFFLSFPVSPPQPDENEPTAAFVKQSSIFLHPSPSSFITCHFSFCSLSLTAARREQTHPGATVQLEGRYKAQGQHLHRRQSRVRVRPLHSLFPHLTQRARQSPVQFLRRGDCLPPLQPKAHRHHLPCAP